MKHMGIAVLRGDQLDTLDNGNRSDLLHEFNTNHYLSPNSDIVALMVLEHQSQMHNTITRAEFSMRQLQHESTQQLVATKDVEDEWRAQIHLLAKSVVDCMLFSNEFRLTSEVSGLEAFAKEFIRRGPQDCQNRSLRDFDMKTRMFKYPCSYLIYSAAFDSLQQPLRIEIYDQLLRVLSNANRSDDYKHLDDSTRASILEILIETKSGLPENWKP